MRSHRLRHSVPLLALLGALVVPSAYAGAQRPGAAGAPLACGAFWLYPQPDSSVRFRRAADGTCGTVQVDIKLVAYTVDEATIEVSAVSQTESFRAPLRLVIARGELREYAKLTAGEQANAWRQFLIERDDVNPQGGYAGASEPLRIWRLSDAAADDSSLAILPAGTATATRTLRIALVLKVGPTLEARRLDSLYVPFRVTGLRPAPTLAEHPPAFDAQVHLRDVPLIRDRRIFPLAFYDGVVALRFSPRTTRVRRQQTMDLLQGTVLGERMRPGAASDLIVRVTGAWRDSVRASDFRDLPFPAGSGVDALGLVTAPDDSGFTAAMRVPVDTTLIDRHRYGRCRDPADRRLHRRRISLLPSMTDPAERERLSRLFGGRWYDRGDVRVGRWTEFDVVGTREQVERIAAQMSRDIAVHLAIVWSADCNGDMYAAAPPHGSNASFRSPRLVD